MKDKYTPLIFSGYEEFLVYEDTIFDGLKYLFIFENGYAVSVIKHMYSYGSEQDLFECGTTKEADIHKGMINVNRVRGFLSNQAVIDYLKEVRNI